jgi:hypothetical protein
VESEREWMKEIRLSQRLRIVFAWFDFWIGGYWNREAKRLYLFPVPFAGLRIDFGPLEKV